MNFLQHYSGGWNIEAIVFFAILWFVAVPAVACVIAARVFEEQARGEVTGKSVFYGLVTGVRLGFLVGLAFLAVGGMWTAAVAPPVAVVIRVLAIRAYYRNGR